MARQQVIDFKYAKPEVDVWAMAASLYNVLTGAVPRNFPPGRDPLLVVLEIAVASPSGGGSLRCRSGWPDVIDRALVEEPEIPFKTAAELKEALENAHVTRGFHITRSCATG